MMSALLLSGAMRWDVLRPWRRFGDRFVLSAGPHRAAGLRHAGRAQRGHAGPPRAHRRGRVRLPRRRPLGADLGVAAQLRRRGGLPGHAEMEGRTLFLKFNTGPSGHGMPPAAGEALSLKLAGADQVKVFVFEGEGGLTPGSAHETKNLAWGLGLDNLVFMVDWNDFGIDPRPASSVVAGTPVGLVRARTAGGSTAPSTAWSGDRSPRPCSRRPAAPNPGHVPTMAWFRTQKGRGYGKVDAASHGTRLADERRAVLGRPQGVHGPARRRVRGRRPARARRPGRRRGPGRGQPAHRHERAAPRR